MYCVPMQRLYKRPNETSRKSSLSPSISFKQSFKNLPLKEGNHTLDGDTPIYSRMERSYGQILTKDLKCGLRCAKVNMTQKRK